ncbi:5-hydroxytryptamine receptor 1D-like [Paramacrobiotus metropolitanus]|uniref:5-hydroxytryptamine receptor 1D-like n=1 Tax=Paramacrobiotus metropolitanus TaxID=2943436 RepID=UPI00244638E2|nr:5-hydroxytryptamine receptor 1D-like [Paramacrobiotus metropolitanus]
MQCLNDTLMLNSTDPALCPNQTGNASTPADLAAPWTYAPIFTIIVFTLVVVSNVLVIMLLSRKFSFSSRPFTLYQVNLMCANLLFVLAQNPLDIYNDLHATWAIGEGACSLYLYANYPLAAGVVQSHLLITTNRLWAMTFPHHYRTHHSLRVAGALCAGMWVYVHVCLGSGWILDAAYYRLPVLTGGCNLNVAVPGQRLWGIITQFLNFNIPIFLMAVAYLRIYVDWRRRQAKAAGPNGERSLYMATMQKRSRSASDSEGGRPTRTAPTVSGTATTGGGHSHPSEVKARKNVHGFLVLTLVTGSVMVNWIPSQGYYTAVLFTDQDLSTLFRVSWILWSLQAALDPFFMALMLDDVRLFLARRLRGFERSSADCAPGRRREKSRPASSPPAPEVERANEHDNVQDDFRWKTTLQACVLLL